MADLADVILATNPFNEFMQGAKGGANILGNYQSAMANRSRRKMLEKQAQAQELKNQYMPHLLESQNKAAALKNQLLQRQITNPLLKMSGAAGQVGAAQYLGGQPDSQAGQGAAGVSPSQIPPTGDTAGSAGGAFSTGNKMADLILNAQQSSQKSQAQRGAYYEKRTTGYTWATSPPTVKKEMVAIAQGMGYDPSEAIKGFSSGKSLTDLADEKGVKVNDVAPIYPAESGSIREIQKRNIAVKGIDAISKHVTAGLKDYPLKIGGISPKQIRQVMTGKNEDEQANFLAAVALTPELNSMRIAAVGGRVGITALHEVGEKTFGKLNAYRAYTSPEVFQKSQDLITKWIDEATKSAGTVLAPLAQRGQQSGAAPAPDTGEDAGNREGSIKIIPPNSTEAVWIPKEELKAALAAGGKLGG